VFWQNTWKSSQCSVRTSAKLFDACLQIVETSLGAVRIMHAKFVTFTQQPKLYELSSAMMDLPYQRVAFRNYPYPAGGPREAVAQKLKTNYPSIDANHMFHDLLQIDADWLICVDEDAFAFAPKRIQSLLEYMQAGNFVVCGVPDGGVIEHRVHNPVACNCFFTILNRKFVVETADRDLNILATSWDESYRRYAAPFVGAEGKQFSYDYFEPYYGFFFWCCKQHLRILYLDAAAWDGEPERCSTLLKDHTGQPFLLHTWYAREYIGSHQGRIDRAMQHALKLRELDKMES
jgi:hypothetical protein